MIEKSTYYHKYKKYKNKYLNKKRNMNKDNILTPSHFYIVHATVSYDSLINILKEGKIKPGKDLPKKYRKWGGDQDLDVIFTNIYFPEIDNLSHLQDFTLILHPKLLMDYDGYFNEVWQGGIGQNSQKLGKDDNAKILQEKLNKIKKFLKSPESLPKGLQTLSGFMMHELVFNRSIEIKDYLIGIECNFCDEKQLDKIKKLVKDDVKILSVNYPLPRFD